MNWTIPLVRCYTRSTAPANVLLWIVNLNYTFMMPAKGFLPHGESYDLVNVVMLSCTKCEPLAAASPAQSAKGMISETYCTARLTKGWQLARARARRKYKSLWGPRPIFPQDNFRSHMWPFYNVVPYHELLQQHSVSVFQGLMDFSLNVWCMWFMMRPVLDLDFFKSRLTYHENAVSRITVLHNHRQP